jgi:hypothetical protein
MDEVSAAIFFGTAEFSRHAAFSIPSFGASKAAVDEALRASLELSSINALDLFGATDSADKQIERMKTHLHNTRKRHPGRLVNLFVYYVGHGYLQSPNDEFYLAHADYTPASSRFGFSCADLGRLIKTEAPDFRVFYVLDCCFSGQAAKELMTDEVARVAAKGLGEIKDSRSSPLPRYGSALFCAATADRVAKAPRNSDLTVFSGALVEVLNQGSQSHGPRLDLGEICELTWKSIQTRYAKKSTYQIRPISMPLVQSDGDISKLRLFPNGWDRNKNNDLSSERLLLLAPAVPAKPFDELQRPVSAREARAVSARAKPPRAASGKPLPGVDFKYLIEDLESALNFGGVFDTEPFDFGDTARSFDSNALANQRYLLRLFVQKLLFASTRIHECALGSANAWVCHRDRLEGGKYQPVSLRSGEREGLFDIDQLVTRIDNIVCYRTNPVSYMNAKRGELSVAAGAIVEGRYVFESVEASKFDSRVEKSMGITHILGFPLFRPSQLGDTIVGVPLVITVDFCFDRDPTSGDRRRIDEACTRMKSVFDTFDGIWNGPKSFTNPRKSASP